MIVLSIDPGYIESGFMYFDGERPVEFGKCRNEDMLSRLYKRDAGHLVVEQIKSYGMPAGDELFGTVLWSGRFIERWGGGHTLLPRKTVAGHICHNGRASDSNVRQAIIDRYGGKEKAIGKKKTPGPLFGVSKDMWSALALAITWWETERP